MEKIIYHIDVNSAFLSWEAVYRLKCLGDSVDLRDIPSAVCGDKEKRHGIILAKSIPAKKFGVNTAETISDALKKCPNLLLVRPQYDLYDQASSAFMNILREYSPAVEQYSVDEAFVDMTGMQTLFGSPVACANIIKDRIYRELGFTVNIGISDNKLLAKMASDFRKPNLVHTLFPWEIGEKMWPLRVGELFFCGRSTANAMRTLGIETIGDLANTDTAILSHRFGKMGEILKCFANGIDTAEVTNETIPSKGYGNSLTVPFNVTDSRIAKQVLLSLCETVGQRIRKDNVKITVVDVSIRDIALRGIRHRRMLKIPTDITKEIYDAACRAFDEMWDKMTPIRQLGVHTSHVDTQTEVRQLDLFGYLNSKVVSGGERVYPYERYERLDRSIDMIRARFGEGAVFRASYAGNNPLAPMSGGILKEKHTIEGEEVFYE